jgi:hypothetical protein
MTENQPDDNWEWETPERRRPRRTDEDKDTADVGFPMIWVFIGGLAGLLTIGLIALGVINLLNKRAAPPPTATVLPTLVVQTSPTVGAAASVETPTLPPSLPSPTLPAAPASAATIAPQPTPPQAVPTPTSISATTPKAAAPNQIKVGGYVKIINTEGAGLSLRAGPGTDNARVVVAAADSIVQVTDGPKPDDQGTTDDAGKVYQWWYLRNTDGKEGWGRADFLSPSSPPAQ